MSTRRGLVFSLAIATALAAGSAAPPPARADTELKVCGVVAVYLPATALLPGAITVGATPFIVAAGTTLGPSVTVGASICFDLTLNAEGGIIGATVVANVNSTQSVCGIVTAYTSATATAAGELTIGGANLAVAVGTALPSAVRPGADLCLHATLNGHGQVTEATAEANAASTLEVCGVVAAYVASRPNGTGTLTIAGRTFVIAAGVSMPASVTVGADLCIHLTLNALGQVAAAAARANLTSTLEVCAQAACGTGTAPSQHPDPGPLPGGIVLPPLELSDTRAHGFVPVPLEGAISDGTPRTSPRASGNVEPQRGQQSPSLGQGPAADAVLLPDQGQILPDTASFGRAGKALFQVSLPLLLLLAGLMGREVILRSRRPASAGKNSSEGGT